MLKDFVLDIVIYGGRFELSAWKWILPLDGSTVIGRRKLRMAYCASP
jgi:hypothetical protein